MLFVNSVRSPEWRAMCEALRCCLPFLQLQNCTGILCDVRKRKEKKKNRQGNLCGGALRCVHPVQGDEIGRKEREDGRKSRREKDRGREIERIVRALWRSPAISNRPSLWLSLGLSDRRCQPARRLCGSLHTSSARTRCSSSVGSRRQRGRRRILLVHACCGKA